jgi:hypothetical protein
MKGNNMALKISRTKEQVFQRNFILNFETETVSIQKAASFCIECGNKTAVDELTDIFTDDYSLENNPEVETNFEKRRAEITFSTSYNISDSDITSLAQKFEMLLVSIFNWAVKDRKINEILKEFGIKYEVHVGYTLRIKERGMYEAPGEKTVKDASCTLVISGLPEGASVRIAKTLGFEFKQQSVFITLFPSGKNFTVKSGEPSDRELK